MADDNCIELLKKTGMCFTKIMIDNLPIVLIIFVVLFMIVGLFRSSPDKMFSNKTGLSRGSGTRNQIEFFKNARKKKKN